MPRKPNAAPGPKSKTHKKQHASFLGDSTADEASDVESFRSPELQAEQTDYGFDYTSMNNSHRTSGNIPSTPTLASTRNTNQMDSTSPKRSQAETTSPRRGSSSAAQKPQASGKSRPVSPNKKKPRKQPNPIQRENLVWTQIRELQKRTDNITPKAPFGRLIREILMQESSHATRITVTALEALQTSSEIYLTNLFADAYVCTLHRGRVTLGVHDLRLVRFLRGTSDAGNKQ